MSGNLTGLCLLMNPHASSTQEVSTPRSPSSTVKTLNRNPREVTLHPFILERRFATQEWGQTYKETLNTATRSGYPLTLNTETYTKRPARLLFPYGSQRFRGSRRGYPQQGRLSVKIYFYLVISLTLSALEHDWYHLNSTQLIGWLL